MVAVNLQRSKTSQTNLAKSPVQRVPKPSPRRPRRIGMPRSHRSHHHRQHRRRRHRSYCRYRSPGFVHTRSSSRASLSPLVLRSPRLPLLPLLPPPQSSTLGLVELQLHRVRPRSCCCCCCCSSRWLSGSASGFHRRHDCHRRYRHNRHIISRRHRPGCCGMDQGHRPPPAAR